MVTKLLFWQWLSINAMEDLAVAVVRREAGAWYLPFVTVNASGQRAGDDSRKKKPGNVSPAVALDGAKPSSAGAQMRARYPKLHRGSGRAYKKRNAARLWQMPQ